jgi:spoIIIJ-associated protein
MTQDLHTELRTFVGGVVRDMGLDVEVDVETLEDGSVRVDVRGDEGEVLLRRKGEGLDALQHIVNTAFRRDLDQQRIVVDCLGFRRSKDIELQQMTKYLIDKVKSSGMPQELGPLNSYARRVVHLEVANDPAVSSESQGDGAVKMVIIALRSPAKH